MQMFDLDGEVHQAKGLRCMHIHVTAVQPRVARWSLAASQLVIQPLLQPTSPSRLASQPGQLELLSAVPLPRMFSNTYPHDTE